MLKQTSILVFALVNVLGCTAVDTTEGSTPDGPTPDDPVVEVPTAEDYDDIASSVAPLLVRGASEDAEVAVEVSTGLAPTWLSFDGEGGYQGSYGSVSWTIDAVCTDADGTALAFCGPQTDGAIVDVALAGDLNRLRYDATLDAVATFTLAGAKTGVVSLTADIVTDASSVFTASNRPVSRTFDMHLDSRYNLAIPLDDLSATTGTISTTVEATRTRDGRFSDTEVHFLVDAMLTLDGSGTGELVIDGDRVYELTLADGTVIRR